MPRLHPLLASTLLMIALIGGAALLGERLLPPAPIEIHIRAPERIALALGSDRTAIPLMVELRNPSSRRRVLRAESDCLVEWLILSAAGRLIEASGGEKSCPRVSRTRALEPYAKESEKTEILVRNERVKRGETYSLQLRFWSVKGETSLRF